MKMIYLMFLTVALLSLLAECATLKNSGVSEFEKEVDATIRRELGSHYDGIRACFEIGHRKAESVGRLRSKDEFVAVIIINMYSSETCLLSSRRNELFYVKLNQELRNDLPGGQENKLWLRVGGLVNKAIEILGRKTFSAVYRGCTYCLDCSLQPFSFRTMTSTSRNPRVAAGFSRGETLIQIKDARGLKMDKYSDFPMEEEVLLRSTDTYSIEKCTKNETEIRKELNKISPGLPQVKLLVHLRQTHRRNFISSLLSRAFRRRT